MGKSASGGRGANALLKFCRARAQVAERLNLPREPTGCVSRRKAQLRSRFMRLLGAGDWRRRIGAAPYRSSNRNARSANGMYGG